MQYCKQSGPAGVAAYPPRNLTCIKAGPPSPAQPPPCKAREKMMEQNVLRARDVMTTKVVTVAEEATVSQAVAILAEKRVSGLPVLDHEGRLAGLITEGDLLRRSETGT